MDPKDDRPNYFLLLGLDPDATWDDALFEWHWASARRGGRANQPGSGAAAGRSKLNRTCAWSRRCRGRCAIP